MQVDQLQQHSSVLFVVSVVASFPGSPFTFTNVCFFRAVRAGPASPAAAGPIFGQLTCAKMPYDFGGLFNCCSKSSYSRRNLR